MRRFLFLLLITGLVVFGYYRWHNLQRTGGRRAPENFTPVNAPKIDLNDVKVLAAFDAELSKLIHTVVPSVVSIRTRGITRETPMLIDPSEFFLRGRRGAIPRERRSLGSGVIVSKEGHILTNHHVVAGMNEIVVQLTDGRAVAAQVIGSDAQTDIAVLRIDAARIEPLPLGDSDELRVGQTVLAIGNPFGLQETVTQGIVSAKGRTIRDGSVEFIQTDAAVNQGNSGGPLLNLRGEIVGINSAIYSETGGWLGISFAIPSNTARRALESLIKMGRVVRPYLGVLMSDVTDDLAQQFRAGDTQGALIHDVVAGSPAEKAGLQQGDIIRKFAGRAVKNSSDLRERIGDAGVGAKAELVFLRDGKEQTVTVEIVEAPANLGSAQPPRAPQPVQPGPRAESGSRENVLAGVQVGEIPTALRERLPENAQGVAVTRLQPDSVAAERIQVGDVIEEINEQPVRGVEEFERIAQALPAGQRALLYVVRGRTRAFVVLTPAR